MRPDLRVTMPDGTVVGYAEVGDPSGPPVLYLHGSPSSRLEVGLPGIREAAAKLGLRVLAPDRPGVGLSTFRRYSIADYPQSGHGPGMPVRRPRPRECAGPTRPG